jgi:hypothetical protein
LYHISVSGTVALEVSDVCDALVVTSCAKEYIVARSVTNSNGNLYRILFAIVVISHCFSMPNAQKTVPEDVNIKKAGCHTR